MREIPKFPKNALLLGTEAEGAFPPWTDEQRDAQIVIARLAWFELVRTLHERGIVNMKEIQTSLDEACWMFEDNSPKEEVLYWYRETLASSSVKMPPFVQKVK